MNSRLNHFKDKLIEKCDVINWSKLDKTILVLLLGAMDHALWIVWALFCFSSSNFSQWINADYFYKHVSIMGTNFILFLLLILPCLLGRNNTTIQKTLPFISVGFFACAFMYGGYSVGISSPATIAGYISLFSVGFVLFDRKLIYSIFIPISTYLLSAIYFSAINKIEYGPIFSDALKDKQLFHSEFWVSSMVYFYIPIFVASMVLFELILIQWSKREKFIKNISIKDPLTDVFNRREISEKLIELQTTSQTYAVILLDLDHFKNINDFHGHEAGDKVLKDIARKLTANVRSEDIVGRFGGEEFIIVLKNTSLKEVLEIAERCRHAIEVEKIILNHLQVLNITASFGVSISTQQVLSKEVIVRQADQALYLAKGNGRNQVRHYFELEQT